MINCLIFSKDRAMQLNLLLESIQDNFKELDNIQILYKFSNNDYKIGYDLVQSIHKDSKFRFIEEYNFIAQTKQIINLFNQSQCIFFADDEIVIRDYEIETYIKVLEDNSIHGISLRLAPTIDWTYTTNIPTGANYHKHNICNDNFLYKWEWKNYNPLSENGYIGNINSMIYRTPYMKACINSLPFQNVNTLEEYMFKARVQYPPYLTCFSEPKSISIANNITQSEFLNNKRSDKIEYSLENLNKKFLDGYKISTNNLYGIKSNMATMELSYEFCKI